MKLLKKLNFKFFTAPEECKRRVVKTEDDDAEAEMDIEEDTTPVSDAVDGDIAVEQEVDSMDGVQKLDSDDKANAETTPTTAQSVSRPSLQLSLPSSPPSPTQSPSAPSVEIKGGNTPFPVPSQQLSPSLTSPKTSPAGPAPEINGTGPTTMINTPGFHFPGQSNGTSEMGSSSFNQYLCDFSLTSNNLSAFPAHSATTSMNMSQDFWFCNGELNRSTFSQGGQVLY